jgi:serine/threonine protein kinase
MILETAPSRPWNTPPGSSWGFGPRDAFAPGREVIRRLGSGSAHEAYLVDTGSRRLAVAKLLRPRLAGDMHCLLGLKNEARALQRLSQRAVPRHLDTVLSGPHPHLLMEYVPGPTLEQAIAAREPLSVGMVAGLGQAIAFLLDRIAAAGWVHLDVKPSNIVLNACPCLLDFELARPTTDAARMRLPTGTWAFMPPEQRAAGNANAPEIGPPADVFALAVSLGEALVGHPLARTPAWQSGLPGPLGVLLGEALAREPSDRPTAAELAAGLARHAEPDAALGLAA